MTGATATTRPSNDSDWKAPLIDASSPHIDDNVSPESRGQAWRGGTEPPATDGINVDTGAKIGTTIPGPDPFPDEGPNPDQLLFDFEGFLEGGALDDIPDSTPKSIPTSDGGNWEVTKLRGGYVNVTVRASPRRGGDKPRSVVIKYAPPFVAAVGEEAPFATFRQVRIDPRLIAILCTPAADLPSTPVIYQNANLKGMDTRL